MIQKNEDKHKPILDNVKDILGDEIPEWFNDISPEVPEFVISLLARYIKNSRLVDQTIEKGGLNPELAKEFRHGFALIGNEGEKIFEEYDDDNTPDNHFQAGSSIKPLFFEVIGKHINEFQVTTGLLLEMIGRDQLEHILTSDAYSSLLSQIALPEGSMEVENTLSILRNKANDPELYKTTVNVISKRIELIKDLPKIDFQELSFCTLKVSCNNGLAIARNTYIDYLASKEYWGDGEKFQKGLDFLQIELSKLTHDDYEMLRPGSSFGHWKQPGANTGTIYGLTQAYSYLVGKSLGSNEMYEKTMMANLTNNEIDFKFCFTHSKLGQALIKTGWKIIEKTGSYSGAVRWIPKLADEGCPPHGSLATFVTVVPLDKNLKPVTFGYYKMSHVALPRKSDGEKEFDDEGLPYEWGPKTMPYYQAVEAKASIDFRNEIINNLLQNVDKNLSIFAIKNIYSSIP